MYSAPMPSIAPELKKLRLTAKPAISMRQTAAKLGLGHSSYALYENPNTYKKSFLPIDFARKLAVVFSEHGIDPSDVMKLAGLTDSEAEPEARDIESQRPTIIHVSLPVAMPSEVALRDMFENLLMLIPDGTTQAEAAGILARRLPAALAGIGPIALDQGSAISLADAANLQSLAKDRPVSRP
jgi:hypothetical protein